MKSSWKGSLAFGLVDIPVELYAAVQPHSLGLSLLHTVCHTPLNYLRWCSCCQQEVAWQDIEKGIQLKDGGCFALTPAALKKLRPLKTEHITVLEFVDPHAIDPVLYDKHYYVTPTEEGYQAFFVITAALAQTGKAAIGQFVLRDKQYVCVLRPYRNILLLTMLNYGYEINPIPPLHAFTTSRANAKALSLAEEFIQKLSHETFAIEQYKDTFAREFIKKAKLLKKGSTITKKEKESTPAKPLPLTKALEESVRQLEQPAVKKIARK